jgi:hypothetical protein
MYAIEDALPVEYSFHAIRYYYHEFLLTPCRSSVMRWRDYYFIIFFSHGLRD